MSQEANDYSKDSPLAFADTSLVFNFAIKTAGIYNTHFVDTHGYIQYVVKNLGIEFTDKLDFYPKIIPTHRCTPEDFAAHDFYSYEKGTRENLLSMECYDLDKPINLYGNLDTESANVIVIEIVKCTG